MNRNLRQALSISLSAALIAGTMAGCSEDLGPETLPSTTESTEFEETVIEETEPSEETEETSESVEETSHGPMSTPIRSDHPVDINGQLKIDGGKLVNKNGEQVQLRGISTAGLNKCADIFNENVISTLGYDWGCDTVRLVVVTEGGEDPDYNKDSETYFNLVCKYADTIIDQGLYVIIDWHIKDDGDPMKYKDNAVDFFSRISAIYGDKENVIYEICNEPDGKHFDDETKDVTWSRIRKYANEVIDAIRQNDKDNIIICGTPDGCRGIDSVIDKPLKDDNVCYAVHNYTRTEEGDLRDKCTKAMEAGLCLWASEWTALSTEDPSTLDLETASEWLDYLDTNKICWNNFSIGNIDYDAADAIMFNSDVLDEEEKIIGHWPQEFLSDSGVFVKNKLIANAAAGG